MKRRVAQCVAGACVAGMVAVTPGAAFAGQMAGASGELTAGEASIEYNAVLYGPPGSFSLASEEIIPELYGPPVPLYGPPGPYYQVNPMTVSTFDKSAKASKLASSSKKFTKAIVVRKAKGKVTYSRVKKKSSKKLSVNKANGAITVKKGTKPGLYRIKVRVKAAGEGVYKSMVKTVTVKVRVK